MIWQNVTADMDPEHAWAEWTYDYSLCYLIGPFIGAFVAGTVFNHMQQTVKEMENGDVLTQDNANGVDHVRKQDNKEDEYEDISLKEESEKEKLPKQMPWKRYFEPAIVVQLMNKDGLRFWLFGMIILLYYLLQLASAIAIVNFYGDTDRFISCNIDNYRSPLDAAAVFDKPLLILEIYHIIEWLRTTVLLCCICIGPDVYWLMYVWYVTIFNTLFGLAAIIKTMGVLATEEGRACAIHQAYRAEWLRIEVVVFWLCFFLYTFPLLALRLCSKDSHDEILSKEDDDSESEEGYSNVKDHDDDK